MVSGAWNDRAVQPGRPWGQVQSGVQAGQSASCPHSTLQGGIAGAEGARATAKSAFGPLALASGERAVRQLPASSASPPATATACISSATAEALSRISSSGLSRSRAWRRRSDHRLRED